MDVTADSLLTRAYSLLADGGRAQALALLVQAAELGHGRAFLELARQLRRDDPETGLRWLLRGGESGDDACRHQAAVWMMTGRGSQVDEAGAAELLRASAERGYRLAADELAGLGRRQASRERTPTENLAVAVAEFGLNPYSERIGSVALPSVRLVGRPADDAEIPVGASKLGGAPDLAADADWPEGTDGPLSFIAQVDTAVRPDTALGLKPGLLSFFYDADRQPWGQGTGWWVLFTADTGTLHRTPTPAGTTEFRAVALTPRPELTVPPGRSMEGRGLGLDDDDSWDRYLDLLDAFADDFNGQHGGLWRHRMFGHPDAIQGDMRRRIEAALRGVADLDAAPTPELDEAARQWVLLLQVDSDGDAGMMWGDAGRLFYWIPRQALAAGDFSAVVGQLQCH